jgi:hypothetical protein
VGEDLNGVALVELAPGEVGDVPGARVGLVKLADEVAETPFVDEEVILSADTKEDINPDSLEMKLFKEFMAAASAEGLKGSSVNGDLKTNQLL